MFGSATTSIKYLISFVLPRFCDQSLERSRKADLYPGAPGWIAKLDTVVHELYHIDPDESGIRRFVRADGSDSMRSHGPQFYEHVAEMVKAYLASNPDPAIYDFLEDDFAGARPRGTAAWCRRRSGTFRRFRSATWSGWRCRADCSVRVEPLKPLTQPVLYTEDDLHVRQFTGSRTNRLSRKGQGRAA